MEFPIISKFDVFQLERLIELPDEPLRVAINRLQREKVELYKNALEIGLRRCGGAERHPKTARLVRELDCCLLFKG